MPVTAKLSRKFYEKLGDDVANELVEWFNLIDATYRFDLKELNELNFARFDAKLEQRVAELRAEMQAGFTRAEAELDRRIGEVRAEMQAGFARAEAGFARVDAKLEQRLAQLETRLTKRMFTFWIAQAATTAGLVLGVVKVLRG